MVSKKPCYPKISSYINIKVIQMSRSFFDEINYIPNFMKLPRIFFGFIGYSNSLCIGITEIDCPTKFGWMSIMGGLFKSISDS